MAEKWKSKRIVALNGDGCVLQVDGKFVNTGHTRPEDIDSLLNRYGDAGWRVVSTNTIKFEGVEATQYLLERSAGPLRD